MKSQNYILGISLILLAFAYRFIPALPNFSPATGAFLFAGAVLVKKYKGLLVVLAIMILSDFLLNNTLLRVFYPNVDGLVLFQSYMIFTLISYALIFAVGSLLIKKITFLKVLGGTLISSLVFFLLTNAGAWVFDPMNLYPNDISGFFASIAAGIPFFQTSMIADLLFSGVLFGSYYLASQYNTSLVKV